MDSGFSLTEWLESTQEKRDELDAYGRSPLPCDAGERHAEMEKSIQAADDSGRLLADAETFLSQCLAQSVLYIRDKYPELTADERKIMIRDRAASVQRLVHGIAVTNKTLNTRLFVMQNQNRSRL